MKIVIDIPEKTYKYAKKYANSPILSVRDIDRCMDAISKGEIEQEPNTDITEKIHKMKSEIADSLEFWDYSPNNNPLARDMLETITNFWGEVEQ